MNLPFAPQSYAKFGHLIAWHDISLQQVWVLEEKTKKVSVHKICKNWKKQWNDEHQLVHGPFEHCMKQTCFGYNWTKGESKGRYTVSFWIMLIKVARELLNTLLLDLVLQCEWDIALVTDLSVDVLYACWACCAWDREGDEEMEVIIVTELRLVYRDVEGVKDCCGCSLWCGYHLCIC